MGGSSRSSTTSSINQRNNSTNTLGSTPQATAMLDDYQTATQNALDTGPWQGDLVAAPTARDQMSPILGQVDGLIADPGAPLEDYTADVSILDRYMAGMTGTSRDALNSGAAHVQSLTPQIQQTSSNLTDFWNRVSSGEFLDPNQNTALQGYLTNFGERANDEFARSANQFRNQAIDQGAYSDTNYARGANWMVDEHGQNMQDQLSRVLYQNYGDEMGRIERAAGGSAQALELGLQPTVALDALGERMRAGDQLEIDNTLARNSEVERGQWMDIQDQTMRRADQFGRDQALLDNDREMAMWGYNRDASFMQDQNLRDQVDQVIRQAGLTNDQYRFDANRLDDMTILERYFGGLSNQVFGSNSTGTTTGTQSSTTTSSQQPGLGQILGGAASLAAAAFGGPAGAAAASALGGMTSGPGSTPSPAMMGWAAGNSGTPFAPFQASTYMPSSGQPNTQTQQTPWWMPQTAQTPVLFNYQRPPGG